jgi:hypothetical protein
MPFGVRRVAEQPIEAYPLLLSQKARVAAQRWLSRLAPLLEEDPPSQAEQCRSDLALLETLRPAGERVQRDLQQHASANDATLLETVRQALDELDGIESNLRLQLAALAPGDPEGEVDLAQMRTRLAEVAAHREVVGVAGPLEQSTVAVEPLTLIGSEPWWGQAAFLGAFGIAWLAFFGALGNRFIQMLGYLSPDQIVKYCVGWLVGAAIGCYFLGWGIQRGSREEVTLEGRKLTFRWRFGPFHWSRQHLLAPEDRVYHVGTSFEGYDLSGELTIRNAWGKWLNFGRQRPIDEQRWLHEKINAYLDELPSEQELPAMNGVSEKPLRKVISVRRR